MAKISYEEASRIMKKYPDKVPILVVTTKNIDLDRKKYLVPFDLTLGGFMVVLRKRIRDVEHYEGLYSFVDGKMFTSKLYNAIYMGFYRRYILFRNYYYQRKYIWLVFGLMILFPK